MKAENNFLVSVVLLTLLWQYAVLVSVTLHEKEKKTPVLSEEKLMSKECGCVLWGDPGFIECKYTNS